MERTLRSGLAGLLCAALLGGCGGADEHVREAKACVGSPPEPFTALPAGYAYKPLPAGARAAAAEHLSGVFGELTEMRLVKPTGAFPALVFVSRIPEDGTEELSQYIDETVDAINEEDPEANAHRAKLASTPIIRAEIDGDPAVVGARKCFAYIVVSLDKQLTDLVLGVLAITPLERPKADDRHD